MKLVPITRLAILAAAMLVTPSVADIPLPTTLTVLFQKNGKPYSAPLEFQVRCYGWSGLPGKSRPEPYSPKEVYGYSGSCPEYRCRIRHSFHLNYKHIDYCDVEGVAEGKAFRVENFGNNPQGICAEDTAGSDLMRNCELSITLPQ